MARLVKMEDLVMTIINWADYTNSQKMSNLCKTDTVIFDLKFYDIPATMRRNVRTCAELGGHAVTVSDDPLNYPGIAEALQAGKDYGIEIIVGSLN